MPCHHPVVEPTVTEMDRIANFRGIGGLPTTDGRTTVGGLLWRSGHLGRASDADLVRLQDLGIRTVVDLRNEVDSRYEGADRIPEGAVGIPAPIPDEGGFGADIREFITTGDVEAMRAVWSDGRAAAIATKGARNMVEHPGRVEAFCRVVDLVTDADRWPLVWHCSAGKDRAGWVGTILLLALGVERDAIVEHYLESNRVGTRRAAALVDGGMLTEEGLELMRPFIEVAPAYVEAQLAAVDDRWGGAGCMLRDGLGLTEDRIADLRDRLLD